VLAVPTVIPGVAFFPGGYGLWRTNTQVPLPNFPVGGIMVLGHDFHSETGYRESLLRGRESATQPTWRALLKLFDRADVDLSTCFFTNVFMGLRAGHKTTGPFPGATERAFVEHCLTFLDEQLRAQRPKLIVTLGVNVPPLLARLSPELAEWATGRGLKHLDRVGPVKQAIHIGISEPTVSTVVALTHPSMRHASVNARRYKGESGDAAELRMLLDGMDLGPSRTDRKNRSSR